jgi:hypothetical protein
MCNQPLFDARRTPLVSGYTQLQAMLLLRCRRWRNARCTMLSESTELYMKHCMPYTKSLIARSDVTTVHEQQIAAADDSIATAEAEARRLKADVKVSNNHTCAH